jgi:hypothetical protein
MWDALRQDITFRRADCCGGSRGFAAVAILALALGIGANTAIFSVVDAVSGARCRTRVLTRSSRSAKRGPREGRVNGPVAPADFFDWRRDSRRSPRWPPTWKPPCTSPAAASPNGCAGFSVSAGFLSARWHSPAARPRLPPRRKVDGRVVLVHDIALAPAVRRRSLDRRPRADVQRNPYEVVGVLPASFWWPTRPDVLVPLALDDHDRTLRAAHFLIVVGRRKPISRSTQAREEMAIIGRRLSAAFPGRENANSHDLGAAAPRGARRRYTHRAARAARRRRVSYCSSPVRNVATLLLARATTRRRNWPFRMAVGGGRVRLIQQMLTESFVLAMREERPMLLAVWSIEGLRGILPAQFSELPGIDRLASMREC